MKKHVIIIGVLAALLIAALLAGCGGGGGGTTASPTQPATTAQTTSPGGATTTSPGGITTTPAGNTLSETLAQAADYPTVKYDMIVSGAGQPGMTVAYWMKNKKIRMEMEDQGVITLMDMEAQTMYMYMPAQNMAYKMVFDTSQAPEDPGAILEYSPEIIGTETIDGKTCTVIEYNYGAASTKSWIWNENGFPVKMESTSGGDTVTTEWKNFDFSDIPDSMFELPEGVQIMELST